MRVVVTAGYGKSLHAVAVIHGLAARGHEVAACFTVRVLDARRLRAYWRQLGLRKSLSRAVSRMLGGSGRRGVVSAEVAPVQAFLSEHGFASRTVTEACAAVGAKQVAVRSLNESGTIAALRSLAPDLVVYAGGGIVRREFLSVPRIGVLNGHGGPLPAFRGMNSAEWALWCGVHPVVTAMQLDEGIDTGPILFDRPVPGEAIRNGRIDHVRGAAMRVTVETLLEAVDQLDRGEVKPVPQDPAGGRQFFVMAEAMIEVVERRLRAGQLGLADAAEFRFPDRGRGGLFGGDVLARWPFDDGGG